jgi:hypothetical protein
MVGVVCTRFDCEVPELDDVSGLSISSLDSLRAPSIIGI